MVNLRTIPYRLFGGYGCKLPAPFVTPMILTWFVLLLLMSVNPLYLWFDVDGNAGASIFFFNIFIGLSIIVTFAIIARSRYENFMVDAYLAKYFVIIAIFHVLLMLVNFIFLTYAVVECHIVFNGHDDTRTCFFMMANYGPQPTEDIREQVCSFVLLFTMNLALIWQMWNWLFQYGWLAHRLKRLARDEEAAAVTAPAVA